MLINADLFYDTVEKNWKATSFGVTCSFPTIRDASEHIVDSVIEKLEAELNTLNQSKDFLTNVKAIL